MGEKPGVGEAGPDGAAAGRRLSLGRARRRRRRAFPPWRPRRPGSARPSRPGPRSNRPGPARADRKRIASRVQVRQRAVARRQGRLGILQPPVGVHVAARLLGEGRPGQHHVGQVGQRRDLRVLHHQELDLRAQRLALGFLDPGVDRVRCDVQALKLAGRRPPGQLVVSDHLPLEVLEDRGHALAGSGTSRRGS